jgi:hypothetical protein
LYIGGYPSYQYRQAEEPPDTIKRTPGKLLGQSIEWHTWKRGKAPAEVTTMEALLPMSTPGSGHGLMLHVFLSAVTEAELFELRKIAESLRSGAAK